MFNKPLAQKTNLSIEKELIKTESTNKTELNLHFREILCPITNKPLEAENCEQCKHKEVFNRKHPLGFTLKTIICTFNED